MMPPLIIGIRKAIAKQLFRRTQKLPYFSINTLRELRLNELFKDPREHGGFFTDLYKDGLIVQVGETKANHPKARGRMVKTWKWTYHARMSLRTDML